ncbi:MAG: hypothetical protein HQK49_02515 [Oligoflexia bacterium]|nr:hypothetical protein [Oligoflexia bacterium]
MTLKCEGISTFSLQSTKESFNFIEDILPDLLLIDLTTFINDNQNDNGQDFIEQLKLNPKTSNIPIVGMGSAEDLSRLQLQLKLQLQFKHFIKRPFSISQLGEEIKNILK